MTKYLILVACLVAVCSGGAVPVAVPAALTVGTYAQSYNAHAVNHAVAAPYVAAASPYIAAAAPYIAAPAAVGPAPIAYSATYPGAPVAPFPFAAFGAYSAPLIAARR